ncbi:hypothetical protein M8994_20525, partial [Brucella sp. 21LCYQ03]|nr:hypothetical protein [Brucella sp. 21LCYQ03]
MNKIVILLIVLGCISFTACEKEERYDPEILHEQTLELNGKIYEVDFLKRGLSRLLGIPIEKLVYDEVLKVFRHIDFAALLDPIDY